MQVGIKILDGQCLLVDEHIVADSFEYALFHAHEDAVIQQGRQYPCGEDDSHHAKCLHQRDKVRVCLPYKWEDIAVYQPLEEQPHSCISHS